MSKLLDKLKYQRAQKELDNSDENVLIALQYLLSSVKEGWIYEHFSVANINSQFNEIVAKAKAEKTNPKKPNFANYDNSTQYTKF